MRTSASIDFRENEAHLSILPQLRETVSPEEFEKAWAEGEKLSFEEAVALGLS